MSLYNNAASLFGDIPVLLFPLFISNHRLALILLFYDASLNSTIDPLLSMIVENFVLGYLLTNSIKL